MINQSPVKNKSRRGYGSVWRSVRPAAPVFAFIAIILTSCTRTVYLPTETVHTEVRTDTLRQTQVIRDSIYHRDSIYIDGETVIKERWRYKYMTHRDTVYKVRVDTVHHTREVTRVIERPAPMPRWRKVTCAIGVITLILLALTIIIYVKKLMKK